MARRRRSNTGIPGVSFSWKRALGLSRARQRFARQTGIPTTRGGMERKIGRMVTRGCLSVVLFWFIVTCLVTVLVLS